MWEETVNSRELGRYKDSFLRYGDSKVREEDVLRLVEDRRNYTTQFHATYFRRIKRWYDYYRGLYTGLFPAYRNNIHIPILFSKIWSDIAYKVSTSFGQYPYVGFKGFAPEDGPPAQKVAALVNAQLDDATTFALAVDFYAGADIYGTGVSRLGWKNVTHDRLFRAKVADYEFKEKRQVTDFDGPVWENVDILDFWPQPGRVRIPDMDWVIHRFYIDYDTILEQMQGPFPPYDGAAVRRLREAPMSLPAMDMLRERLNIYRNFSQWQQKAIERYTRPVEIWEMWGTVPQEYAVKGIRDVVITVANNKVVLRYEPNPFWHGLKPFLAYSPCPDPHYFHGTGKIEIGEKAQAASNRIINQKLDALDMFMDPMFLVSRGANIDVQNLFTKPGRVFQVDGAVDDTQIRPLQADLRGMQAAFADLEALNRYIAEGTGILDDTVAGTQPGNRQTAREFLGRREASMTRLGLESRLFEVAFVEPLADQFHFLNQQFLTLPKQIAMIGSAAVTDPLTGLPLPPMNPQIDVAELSRPYKARALGASQALSKSVKAQNMMLALQAVGGNPLGLQLVNWVGFFTDFFRALDLDPAEMLVQGQIPLLNQMAAQQGMDSRQLVEALAQGGQTNLPQLEQGRLGTQGPAPMPVMQPENVTSQATGGELRGKGPFGY